MPTLTVYPGMKPDGTRASVLASDLVTPIPDAGAVVEYGSYYMEMLSSQILLDHDPVNSGGTPIEILVPPVLVTGTPSAGQVLEATGPTAATWDDPTGGGALTISGEAGSSISADMETHYVLAGVDTPPTVTLPVEGMGRVGVTRIGEPSAVVQTQGIDVLLAGDGSSVDVTAGSTLVVQRDDSGVWVVIAAYTPPAP